MAAALVILLLSQARLSQHPGGCPGKSTFTPRSLPRLQDDWKMPVDFWGFLGGGCLFFWFFGLFVCFFFFASI